MNEPLKGKPPETGVQRQDRLQWAKRRRKQLLKARRGAAIEREELFRHALEGLDDAKVNAQQHGIKISVSKGRLNTPHVQFDLGRFHVGDWWPSTHRLIVGSVNTQATTISEALRIVVEYIR